MSYQVGAGGRPDAPPTAALLRIAYNRLSRSIFEYVAAAGHADLRPAHGNVLEHLGYDDGLRLSDLAARAGMTAQSMGELVDDLERRGYVARRRDPADGRAKLIHLTPRGLASIDASIRAIVEIEHRLERALGPQSYRRLRAVVGRVIEGDVGPPPNRA